MPLNKMKGLRRLFSQIYPYHPSKDVQKLVDFPLQFYTDKMPRVQCELQADWMTPKKSVEVGMKQAFQMIMSSLVEDKLDDLEDLMEYNFFQKLKAYFKDFKEQGYNLTLRGSIEDTEIVHLSSSFISGSVLPYRNLNFPSECYKILDMMFNSKDTSHYFVKIDQEYPKSFKEFNDLNLSALNKQTDLSAYQTKLQRLFKLLDRCPVLIQTIDVGVLSSLKLNVLDRDGNLIEGINSSTEKEYHCIRAEQALKIIGSLPTRLFSVQEYDEFVKKNFADLLEHYIVTDIDGYMNGNLVVPV